MCYDDLCEKKKIDLDDMTPNIMRELKKRKLISKNIFREVDENNFFSTEKVVHDAIRGHFCKNGSYKPEGKPIKPPINEPIEYIEKNSIVLILESPHKDEYDDEFRPIAPAWGTTGSNIENPNNDFVGQCTHNHIHKEDKSRCLSEIIIEQSKTNKRIPLVIANPIQWQTSLYHVTKRMNRHVRNSVWEMIWGIKKIQEYFTWRLTEYKPIAVINACTKYLAPYIDDYMRGVVGELKQLKGYYTLYHPCCWNYFRKRGFIRKDESTGYLRKD